MFDPSSAESVRSNAQAVLALAGLLERIENSPIHVDAAQYQAVVSKLKAALHEPLPGMVLDAVLSGHSAAAEVYENLHYARSGLSRSTLDASVESERLASELLARVARRRKPG
ncbi:MAG: hypothetical protein AB9M60_13895 [Leptothrix sp. (in: b-proteobacteria)]